MQSGKQLTETPYELPSLEELGSIDLHEYLGKKNPHRQAFRILYQKIILQTKSAATTSESNKNSQELLASALLFEYTNIVSKYPSETAAEYTVGLFGRHYGSRMKTLLRQKLHFTERSNLSSEKRLILLAKLYKFVKTSMGDDVSDGVHWGNKEALLASIKTTINFLLQKQPTHLEEVLSSAPPLGSLIEKCEQVRPYYKKTGSHGYFPDVTRELQFTLIEYINESCRVEYGNDVDCNAEQRAIRMGAFYYLAVKTRKGTLHDYCMAAINKPSLSAIEKDDVFLWQTLLLGHLERIKLNHSKTLSKWEAKDKEFGPFLNIVQADLLAYTAAVKIKQLDPASERKLNKVTRIAASYGVKFVASNAAQGAIDVMGGGAIDGGVGAVCLVLGGPVLGVVGAQLSYLARNKLIPDAAMYMCGDILTAISNRLGDIAGGATSMVYTLTLQKPMEGAQSLVNTLFGFYSEVEDEQILEEKKEYIEALKSLPDDVFSKEKKEIIRYTTEPEKEQDEEPESQSGLYQGP